MIFSRRRLRAPKTHVIFGGMRELTRMQVARMMGKSVATVRRLEGHVLFPRRDLAGVYRFDDWDVRRLIEQPDRVGRWARSQWFERTVKAPRKRSPLSHRLSTAASMSRLSASAVLATIVELLSEIDVDDLEQAGIDVEVLSGIVDVLAHALEARR